MENPALYCTSHFLVLNVIDGDGYYLSAYIEHFHHYRKFYWTVPL